MNNYEIRLPSCIFKSIYNHNIMECYEVVEAYNMKKPTIYCNEATERLFKLTEYNYGYKVIIDNDLYELVIK